VSRRLICSLLESETIMVVESNHIRVLSAIKETFPDILVADARSLTPLQTESLSGLGELPSATIVTAYDPAELALFAPIAVDLLVKPFNADRFDAAMDAAKLQISREPAANASGHFPGRRRQEFPEQHFLERLVVESDHKMLLSE
jgi:DNA-binding LytR/AlgR family response regulator